jgi:hypothetical protein
MLDLKGNLKALLKNLQDSLDISSDNNDISLMTVTRGDMLPNVIEARNGLYRAYNELIKVSRGSESRCSEN